MKKSLFIAGVFSFLSLAMFSCKKEWICTCTAQSNVSGQGILTEKDTVPSTEKPAAQADCNKFCSNYFNSSSYSNQSATVAKF